MNRFSVIAFVMFLCASVWATSEASVILPTSVIDGDAERIERATVKFTGTAISYFSSSGSWTASRTAVGQVTFGYTGYSVAPACVCTSEDSGGNTDCEFVGTPTTTAASVAIIGGAGNGNPGSSTDANFHIICMGLK